MPFYKFIVLLIFIKRSAQGIAAFGSPAAFNADAFRITFVIGIVFAFGCFAVNADGLAGVIQSAGIAIAVFPTE